MSSSDSMDKSPATPPQPPEELSNQAFNGREVSHETGSLNPVEIDIHTSNPTTSHQPDKCQDSTDESGLDFFDNTPTSDQAEISNNHHAGPVLSPAGECFGEPTSSDVADVTEVKPHFPPGDNSRANLSPVVTRREMDDGFEEAEKRLSVTSGFGRHESPSLSPVSPTSDKPPNPRPESILEQELLLASPPSSPAISAQDSISSIFKVDLWSTASEDKVGTNSDDDNEEEEAESKDKAASGDEGLEEDTKGDEDGDAWDEPEESSSTSNEKEADDDESIHNPFDFEATPSKAKPSEDYLDSSSVLRDVSANNLWDRMKKQGDKSDVLERLMALVGLENVKIQFLKIKMTIDAARRRKGWLRRQDLNVAFLGKTTVAELYRDFLIESKVWPDPDDPSTIKTSGFSFQFKQDVESFYREAKYCSEGILVLDDIDRSNDKVQESLAHHLGGLDDNLVIIVTGSVTGVSKFLGVRLHSRWECWRRLHLQDYDDEQLRVMLLRLIDRNELQVEGGPESRYPLMAAKRVGRGRNTDSFGNMHEIALAFERTLERQAYRLKQIQLNTSGLDDVPTTDDESKAKSAQNNAKAVLTMEDFMGPEPAELWAESAAWKELDRMAGLEDVKKAVRSLIRRSKVNYHRELQGKEPLQTSLNRMFLGPPGTGKTTVAKIYGQILGELGLISSKEVIFTIPSDFIGPYTGQTEARTSSIVDSAVGKVLIIDDAHTFFTRDETSFLGDDLDSFRRACIDTLVSRIHNKPGEDRSVILVGYADKMEEMFQKCNPGLKRRFPLEEAFRFHDYDDSQLNEILRIKMAKEEITARKEALDVAAEVLRRARDRPNFGNGGDVDNLLNQAKVRFRERKAAEKEKETPVEGDGRHGDTGGATGWSVHHDDEGGDQGYLEEEDRVVIALEPQDFDPEWDRGTKPESGGKASSLFDGLLGFDDIRKQFEGYQLMAANMRRRGKDPRESIPFTYVFKGPPGTGKTHTARIMGKMFYRMGFLSTDDVVECSASHMIGQYTGQTAPKVVSLLDSALGKVLFIDEAYRLTSRLGGRGYESEAIGELVDCMTKPRYLRKMIIILAGYNNDMNQLLKSNAGLRGRFPTEIRFRPMDEELSRAHLMSLLSKQDIKIHDESKLGSDVHETVLRLFYKLGMTEGWSNGRDIQSLANTITAGVYKRMPSMSEESEGNSGGEAVIGGGKGKEKEMGTSTNTDTSSLDSLHISTRELIKFLKDLLRERIKAGGSGDNSGG
ncbi:uncharacterized protein DNG_05271 [Cephalotrichum gorgonifer]|uniref:AAA+ ATPase domain-containing protein n=1 Tax=Cephalotrichum gorgonifer TaxID=2041049 RepID=A0AAE8MZM2_9PEZI|nr:uncharacterized protein DNG_05271 [Cephalotrichum gorgonifer]